MLLLALCAAHAAPADLDSDDSAQRLLRAQGQTVILGGADRGPMHTTLALLESPARDGWYDTWLRLYGSYAPEDLSLDGGSEGLFAPVVGVRAAAWTGLGGAPTLGTLGDPEAGLVDLRGQAELVAYTEWWEARAVPELWMQAPLFIINFPVRQAYAGFRHGPWRAGFGTERLFVGPGRHGALVLGDNAWPMPMGQASYEGPIGRAGALRVHMGMGWLQRPRLDVDHPGVILMDLRWAPTSWLEVGATRFGIFGGEGRPKPPIGQLILPTKPHVYDDPDREEPDQDEIASLDVRLTIPLPGPLDYFELYTQYGGDDLIVNRALGVPVPQLAGIANLAGAELSAGPWVLGAEWARLRDDYFRWYQGHRIYHEGFTQDGRYLGHARGGDQDTLWFRAGYFPGAWGGQLQLERARSSLVLDVLNNNVFVGLTEQEIWRIGGSLVHHTEAGGTWRVSYELERTTGAGFVPGAELTQHRVVVARQGGAFVLWD